MSDFNGRGDYINFYVFVLGWDPQPQIWTKAVKNINSYFKMDKHCRKF